MNGEEYRIGLDTGFFIELFSGNKQAISLYKAIVEGNIIGVVSVIVIFELKRIALKGAINKEAYKIIENHWATLFQIENIDKEIALEAALISHRTGLPTADALIYITYKKAKCKEIYTVDTDFKVISSKFPIIKYLY